MEIKSATTKLNDTNHYKWTYDITMLLKSQDLWKNVNYENIDEYYRMMRRSIGDDEEKKEDDKKSMIDFKERLKWERDDAKCLAVIGMSVGERFIPIIRECNTAKEAWEAIQTEIAGASNSQKLTLKCQFYDARMSEKESLVMYLDRISGIIDKLREIGCKTDESEVCYKILSSIPEKYKAIQLTCLMLPEEQLKINILRQHFTLENQGKKKDEKKVEALSANEKKGKFVNKNKDRLCYKCGVTGHISTDCRAPPWKVEKYKKSREEEKEKEKSGKEEVKVEIKSKNTNFKKKEHSSNVETAINTTTTNTNTIIKENKDVWYFDSGCTQHMTNNLSKLVNLTTANTRVVGAIRKESDEVSVKGECVLRCRIDEEESVVRLKEVLHVPHLRRNLISIKNICEKGLRVEFEGEGCVVMNDDKIVMMGKKDETGLYVVVEEKEEVEEVNYTNTQQTSTMA